jgi:hypothetical protein
LAIARDIIDSTLDYLGVPPDQPEYRGPVGAVDG